MQRKHNKSIVPTARMLRKNMKKKKNIYGMIFCIPILSVFLDKKFWGNISLNFIVPKQNW